VAVAVLFLVSAAVLAVLFLVLWQFCFLVAAAVWFLVSAAVLVV